MLRRRPPFDPPYVQGTEPARVPTWARWSLGAGLVLLLLVILAAAALADASTPEPAEVVTPSPYGYPPALALVAFGPWRRLQAWANRAVYDPSADGHPCHYCTRDARLAFRVITTAPALWQLLTIRGRYACWDHWPWAAGDATRSVHRDRVVGLSEGGER